MSDADTQRIPAPATEADDPSGFGGPAAGTHGVFARIARHKTALVVTAGIVLFVFLVAGVFSAGLAAGQQSAAPVPTTEAVARTVPDAQFATAPLRTCSIADIAADPRLNELHAAVINAETGEVLYSQRADVAQRTASTLKLFTAAAAISVLGPDFRLSTRVVANSVPGSITLIGGGDATLSTVPAGFSFYPNAPTLADLAAQTLAAYELAYPGVPITEVVVDASYWPVADKWDPTWKRSEQTIGYHSEVTALQVDGDRADPSRSVSPRSTDPVARAGQAFIEALGVPTAFLSLGRAERSAPLLAEVKSQPVSALVKHMLLTSDNTLAEMLARVVSKQSGLDGSAASLQVAISGPLVDFGVDPDRITIRDGSGLSDKNAVPAEVMANFAARVGTNEGELAYVYAGLSVAGQSGSLAARFTGANADAAGAVFAKTGWIDTSYSLAGQLTAKDSTPIAFAFYAVRNGISQDAQTALDSLATRVYQCGNNLANQQ